MSIILHNFTVFKANCAFKFLSAQIKIILVLLQIEQSRKLNFIDLNNAAIEQNLFAE